VHYSDDKALGNFLWRITGRRFTFTDDTALARTRIDALIERTQQVLDMYPDKLRVRIELYPAYSEGNIAKYDHKRRTIVVYADKVTDGVFAHEAAHAIICNYFSPPPPEKMQEIIAQYVDRNLWNDY
jgi:hypothetical protein